MTILRALFRAFLGYPGLPLGLPDPAQTPSRPGPIASLVGGRVYAGENSSIASQSTLHYGSMVDELFDRRPERNLAIV